MLVYDPRCKRIGSYLIDAGLLTPDQVDVILMDQKASNLKFGEIAAMRGWIATETIEFIYTKVIEPERVIGSPLKLDRHRSKLPSIL